jgi:hypothetical protein
MKRKKIKKKIELDNSQKSTGKQRRPTCENHAASSRVITLSAIEVSVVSMHIMMF